MNLLLCTLLVLLWPPGLSHDEHSHPEEKDVGVTDSSSYFKVRHLLANLEQSGFGVWGGGVWAAFFNDEL